MSKQRVVLPGSHRDPLVGHVRLGPADPSAQAHVTVVLRRKEEVLPITQHAAPMKPHEYAAIHGAAEEDIQAVSDFANEYNLKFDRANDLDLRARTMQLTGSVADLSRAFGVSLDEVTLKDQVFRVRTGPVTIPKDLIPAVQAVLGLDNRPVAKAHFVAMAAVDEAAVAQALSPLEVAKLYDFPPNLDGSGQTIAIIELDGGFLQSDLDAYFQGLGLASPHVSTILIDGQTNQINRHLPQHPELNADGEVALDIEVAGAIAPAANQKVYFAQNNDQSFLKAINAAISANPTVISISWGHPENTYTAQNKKVFEAALQDAANLGIPVCVAAGDDGSFDGTTALQVDFPASAPHALGCGGTRLIGAGNAIDSETVWNALVTDDQGNTVRQGTGGGVSQFFAKPSYQSSVNVPAPPAGLSTGRGVPDVCGNADPASGYNVLIKGKDAVAGGTSAVAPLWAGLIARFGQSLKGKVGFLHSQIYQPALTAIGFRDITQGDNDSQGNSGLYQATSGWDACTGLGSPKGVALLKALTPPSHPTPRPTPTPTPTPRPTPHPTPSPTPTPRPTPPTPSGGTGGTFQFDFPPVPPPSPSFEPAPTPPSASPSTGFTGNIPKGSNAVALVAVVGLAAVMGMVAATGMIGTVAIGKEKP